MKTITVLLETADEYLEYAVINHNDEKRALFAQISIAAAQLAHAQIVHAQVEYTVDMAEAAALKEIWRQ